MKLILYNSPESEEDRNGLKPSERIRIPCKKAVRLEIAQSMIIPPYGFSESKESENSRLLMTILKDQARASPIALHAAAALSSGAF